jgi:hypothetical protein
MDNKPVSLRNDFHDLADNMHVRIKIYWEFYHCTVHIANKGRHISSIIHK